jgi:hypothetical protein
MLRRKSTSGAERVRYFRMRKKALKSIEYLTLLAKELPEDQLKQVFNKETLTPLFKAVFSLEIEAKDHKDYVKKKEFKEVKEKRRRMLKLSVALLHIIGGYNFARTIVPEPVAPYLSMSFPPIENIRALCYMSLQEE